MSAGTPSSGVRNLRAMFESQQATPEPRGRSPAGSAGDDNSRPTSRVRASFVSVEPNRPIVSDLGTTKGTANGINSIAANRRESFSVSQAPGDDTVAELKKTVSREKEERKNSEAITETIPESAVDSREASRPPPPIRNTTADNMTNLGSILKGSDFPEEPTKEDAVQPQGEAINAAANKVEESALPEAPADNPDKIVTGAQEDASLKPADPKDVATVSGGEALPAPVETLAPAGNNNTTTTILEQARKTATPKTAPSTPAKAKTNGTASHAATNGKIAANKPPAISTTKAPATKAAPAKSPLPKSPGAARVPKTPTTPKAASAKPAPAKEPAKAVVPKSSRASIRPTTTSTTTNAVAKANAPVENKKPATAKSVASKDSIQTSPGGFKKPRPRSPTRPVRLPSHLTAPTASSAAKHDEEATKKLTRKPSTVSRPAPKANPPVRKAPSRASLGPPPAKRPESRASATSGKAPDEGFLARMMRPTTASASKTQDKVSSPPRRAASTRAGQKPSVVAKGKQKVSEAAAKVKDAVTTNGHQNGHQEGHEQPHAETEQQHVEEVSNGGPVVANKTGAINTDTAEAVVPSGEVVQPAQEPTVASVEHDERVEPSIESVAT